MQVREEAKRKIDSAMLRQWAAHPVFSGFVHPKTLEAIADEMERLEKENALLRRFVTDENYA